jgi:hypothetical protein
MLEAVCWSRLSRLGWLAGLGKEMPPSSQMHESARQASCHLTAITTTTPHHHNHSALDSKHTRPGSQSCSAWRLLVSSQSQRRARQPNPQPAPLHVGART